MTGSNTRHNHRRAVTANRPMDNSIYSLRPLPKQRDEVSDFHVGETFWHRWRLREYGSHRCSPYTGEEGITVHDSSSTTRRTTLLQDAGNPDGRSILSPGPESDVSNLAKKWGR
jgi:hypothetical protein